MANANVSRIGQVNQANAVDALFKDIFSGEILTAFEQTNLMMDKHMVRTISNGKSASFPVVGGISAEYHTPGAEINGLDVNHNERKITIDQLLISHAFIADLDEAMNFYDVRSIYSKEMGRKLANKLDKNLFIELIKASAGTAAVTDGFAGESVTDDLFHLGGTGGSATAAAQATALAGGLFKAAAIMDGKDVPEEDRYACFRPVDYYTLVQNTDLINKDWGGAGAYSDGRITKVAGFQILKSNHIVSTDTTEDTDADYDLYHNVDATKVAAIVWQKNAIGTVKLMDLSLQSEWDIRRQGTLIVARYAMGHGLLRPEWSVTMKFSTLTNA